MRGGLSCPEQFDAPLVVVRCHLEARVAAAGRGHRPAGVDGRQLLQQALYARTVGGQVGQPRQLPHTVAACDLHRVDAVADHHALEGLCRAEQCRGGRRCGAALRLPVQAGGE